MNEQMLNEQMINEQSRSVLLELIQEDVGRLVLREARNGKEILVTINVSDKMQDMFGEDAQFIGEHMLQSAIVALMHRKSEQWHANVFDEEPKFYS